MTRSQVWAELRPFIAPAVILVLYALVRLGFVETAGHRGVLTPGRVDVDAGLAVLALFTLVLRLLVLTVVPFMVVYRLVMRGARQLAAPTTSSRK
ncbi:MAG TPA: hypothetical protein VL326_06575 [Kofleriaceae bacterium]|nr:hypothetical protein [Kofleriaceae bacterium]